MGISGCSSARRLATHCNTWAYAPIKLESAFYPAMDPILTKERSSIIQQIRNKRPRRAITIALVLAALAHIALFSIHIQRPEPPPEEPVIELTLDAPTSDELRDAGRQQTQDPSADPEDPRLAGQQDPATEQDSQLDDGDGMQRLGADGQTDNQRDIASPDRFDQIQTELVATLRTGYMTSRETTGPEGEYLAKVQRQIERYGNQNYPQVLLDNNLSGRLVLEVTLNQQGQVLNIAIRRSSGSATLDRAARDLVQSASPYPAFSAELAEKYQRLNITRTWVFTSENQLRTE